MSFQSRERFTIEPDLFTTPVVVVVDSPLSFRQRLAITIAVWRKRINARRCLAQMDARSLRDAGLSPAAAAYEAGKPFWQKMGPLR